jgi:exonuclease I
MELETLKGAMVTNSELRTAKMMDIVIKSGQRIIQRLNTIKENIKKTKKIKNLKISLSKSYFKKTDKKVKQMINLSKPNQLTKKQVQK